MDKWEVFDELEPIGMAQIHKLLGQIVMWDAGQSQVSLKLTDILPWTTPDP